MKYSEINIILQLVVVLMTVYLTNASILKVNKLPTCKTPEGEDGQCIRITECKPHVEIINNHATAENREYIKKLQCGWDERIPKTCCPLQLKKKKSLLPDMCGSPFTAKRIAKGVTAGDNEYPWIARIERKTNSDQRGKHGCDSVIISKRYVLTAAHCIPKEIPLVIKYFNIVIGVKDLTVADPSIQKIPIEEITVHEKFSERFAFDNDIALIRLAQDIVFDSKVYPICLPKKEAKLAGAQLVAAGWGITETGAHPLKLQKTSMKEFDHVACETKYKSKTQGIGSSMMCAVGVNPGGGTCTGDSGGPLMATGGEFRNPTVVGIVSFGVTCGSGEYPDVFTKVSDYIPWIVDKLKP